MNAAAEPFTVQLRHHIPGRSRVIVTPWPGDDRLRSLVNGSRDTLRFVRANPLTGSVLLNHAPQLTADAIVGLVQDRIRHACRPRDPADPRHHRDGADPQREISLALAASLDAERVLAMMGSSLQGLSDTDARRRRLASGANTVPPLPRRSGVQIAAAQVATLPVMLLLGSAALSVATGGLLDAIVTVGVVLINVAIGASSEIAIERLIRRLSQPVAHAAVVRRAGTVVTLQASDLVPGDIIVLAPGTAVPADARLLAARGLSVDESALTGESLPVEKRADALDREPALVAERANVVHAGTVVTGGDAQAVVLRTGPATEMAAARALIGTTCPPQPPIAQKLDRLNRTLAGGSIGVSALVVVLGSLRGEPLPTLARTAIALAVSALPEGLPAIATATLALEARAMERAHIFVRTLPSVEAIGSIDTICLDKTGTLTENRMRVSAAVTEGRPRAVVPGDSSAPGSPDLRRLAEAVALCSEADLGRGTGTATERALLHFAQEAGIDGGALQRWPVVAVLNRNHAHRWMAVERRCSGGSRVAVKGAPDEVLALSSDAAAGEGALPLDAGRRRAILDANDGLARQGLRVLGVAARDGALAGAEVGALTWLGLVALADPVRAEAREAIDTFHRAGIRTVMITGDQPATAVAVAEALALSRTGIIPVADGAALAALDDVALGELALRTSVFARVSPADKHRIVRALQAAGRRVAMIGDGINDGPALRAAAVGIAMGRNGTDVAREVADVVIANDDLRELGRAIARGRATSDNVRSAVHYLLSTNLSELLVLLVEVLSGRGEMETAMELFWLNLVTDIAPALGLALAEPRVDVMLRPPRAEVTFIDRREAAGLGLDGLGMAAAALAAHFAGAARAGPGPRTRSTTFLTLALAQIAHGWVLRLRGSRAPEALQASTRRLEGALAAASGGLVLPFLVPSLRRMLGLGGLTAGDAVLAVSLAAASFSLSEGRRALAQAPAASVPAPVSRLGRTG